jgi:hypothetical protein
MSKLRRAILTGFMWAAFSVAANSPAEAQGAGARSGQSADAAQSIEASAQSRRRRAPTRLYITRERTYLPPTAVRACDAWYEQEFRPSGTVIVPRMRCRWVAG